MAFRKKVAHKRGIPICPGHHGRSKVLVDPSFHSTIETHGLLVPGVHEGVTHLHTSIAHMKEWPYLFQNYSAEIREAADFTVQSAMEVANIHSFDISYPQNADGTWNMYYDDNLEPWMEYVSSRRKYG